MTDDNNTDADYYRDEPTATHDSHLFDAEQVEDSGGGPGEEADRIVPSICSRVTRYGPFHPIRADDKRLLELPGTEEIDLDMCEVCRSAVFGNGEDEGDPDS